MTLLKAKKLAEQSAESSQLDADPSEAMQLLASAVAELARSLNSKLDDIDRRLKALEKQVRR
jgi:chromosome segregation ATPase